MCLCTYICLCTSIHKHAFMCVYVLQLFTVPFNDCILSVDATVDMISSNPAVSVTWTTPTSDLPITCYELNYRALNDSWNVTSFPHSTTSTVVGNLSAGVVYEFRIRATSVIGVGPFCKTETLTVYDGE